MAAVLLLAILITAVIWRWLNRRLFNDFFSPFSLLLYFWILPLSFRGFGLSDLETPWTLPTILVLAWVTIALTITSLLPSCARGIHRPGLTRQPIFQKTLTLLRNRAFIFLLLIFYTISFLTYLYAEFLTNPAGLVIFHYLAASSTLGEASNRWGKDGSLAAITGLLIILTPIWYLAFRANSRRRAGLFFLALASSYPIMGLLKLSKSDVLVPLLTIFAVEYYYRKYTRGPASPAHRPNRSIYVGGLIVLAALLYVMNAIRQHSLPSQDIGIYTREIQFRLTDPPYISELLAELYGYAALNFENFHRFFSTSPGGFHLGISFFRPLLSMFHHGAIADEILSHIDFASVSGAANAPTFLSPIYAELDIFGLIAVPVIYGLFVNLLYLRFRLRPTFSRFFIYLNFVYPWIWMFFTNGFSVLTFYINACFIVLLVAMRRSLVEFTRGGNPKLPRSRIVSHDK